MRNNLWKITFMENDGFRAVIYFFIFEEKYYYKNIFCHPELLKRSKYFNFDL
jgi:hypothetical protein